MSTKRIHTGGGGTFIATLAGGGLWLAAVALPLGAATMNVTTKENWPTWA